MFFYSRIDVAITMQSNAVFSIDNFPLVVEYIDKSVNQNSIKRFLILFFSDEGLVASSSRRIECCRVGIESAEN
jgi:hypothetical protein